MQNESPFTHRYASFGIAYFLNYAESQIDVLVALSNKTHLPYCWLGGKEASKDANNPLNTLEREVDEESSLKLINPCGFYEHRRRNDDGTATPFINHFYFSDEEEKRKAEPKKTDSIKEVKWFSLEEAEALPMRLSHREALIEFCYFLEETMATNAMVKENLKKLFYKFFERPSTLYGMHRIKEKPGVTPYLDFAKYKASREFFPWHLLIKDLQSLKEAA